MSPSNYKAYCERTAAMNYSPPSKFSNNSIRIEFSKIKKAGLTYK
jgi:hypothetical protein